MVVIGFSFHKWLYDSRKINYYKACIQAEREAYSILNNNERRVAMLSLLEFVVTLKKGITENEDAIMKPTKVFFGSRKYNGKINKNVSNYYRTIEEIEQHLNFTLGNIEIDGKQYKQTWKYFRGNCFVSNYGKLYKRVRGKLSEAKPRDKKPKAYLSFNAGINGKTDTQYIHRVVACLFCNHPKDVDSEELLKNDSDWEAHHINKDRYDNRADNLMWLHYNDHDKLHRAINRGIITLEEVNSPEKIRAFLKSYKEM